MKAPLTRGFSVAADEPELSGRPTREFSLAIAGRNQNTVQCIPAVKANKDIVTLFGLIHYGIILKVETVFRPRWVTLSGVVPSNIRSVGNVTTSYRKCG
ncbi:hypothetical protein [Pseudomonas paeninsulae]|uniref:hypothetical protein n=1 Tax=Pseudomonas paeninsulae TaxID=3110772 RepID=UPI002D78966D|nr:hypothetical protein [Pseudomonas sp. IT1137]